MYVAFGVRIKRGGAAQAWHRLSGKGGGSSSSGPGKSYPPAFGASGWTTTLFAIGLTVFR
jgi:hypothetical protein